MGQNASYQVGNEDRINVPDDVDTSHQEPREEQQLIAGKYKTQEDLEKGTLELLRQRGDLEQIYKTLESGKVTWSRSIRPWSLARSISVRKKKNRHLRKTNPRI